MKIGKKTAFFMVLIMMTIGPVSAETITVASGAGYRALVDELSEVFTRRTGIKVEKIYGNMGQVTSQARVSGVVDLVVGDKSFFERAKLRYDEEFPIGSGKLVLAFARGIEPVALETLRRRDIERISHPDATKAIYGRAAMEFLKNSGLADMLSDKLLPVGTVPQVSAYLIGGEVDLGFINLTDALVIKDKIEGYIEISQALYSPILIVALKMPDAPFSEGALKFGRFLDSPEARGIVSSHGL